MKTRHSVFFGFAVMLIAAIFTLAGCSNPSGGGGGGGDDGTKDPAVPASYYGTWKDSTGVTTVTINSEKVVVSNSVSTYTANKDFWSTDVSFSGNAAYPKGVNFIGQTPPSITGTNIMIDEGIPNFWFYLYKDDSSQMHMRFWSKQSSGSYGTMGPFIRQ